VKIKPKKKVTTMEVEIPFNQSRKVTRKPLKII
jgi:hypothetical protein